MLNGGVACYLPYECADGWVSCGALEPKFWQAFCAGVERAGPDRAPVRAAGLGRPRGDRRGLQGARRRREWAAFNDEHDCCIEPVLDLDEALDSELVRAREMVVEVDQPEIGPVRLLGTRSSSRARPAIRRGRRPALGEHTEEVLAESGLSGRADRGAAGVRRRRRPRTRSPSRSRSCREHAPRHGGRPAEDRRELAERAEVPVATIRHYLREGLLPEPVKTSRTWPTTRPSSSSGSG